MTMLDDRLATLLTHAADEFAVPDTGPADILLQARTLAASRGRDGVREDDGSADTTVDDDTTQGTGSADVTSATERPARRREGRLRRAGAAAGRHRVLAVAACVVLVLLIAGLTGAVTHSTSGPSSTSSLRALSTATLPHARSAPASTTTVPGYSVQHAPSDQSEKQNGALGLSSSAARPNATPTTVPKQAPLVPSNTSAKVEQTGTLGLTVKAGALNRAMAQLSAIATGSGGFVASSQTQAGAGPAAPPSGTITLQVPVASFSGVVTQAQALGKTTELSSKATDVTGQYVDLQARISALEATRQQYLTILAKATSIGDVLSVQEQVDAAQSQIEQLQGQLQLLDSQTTYSTLAVTLNEPTAPPRPGPTPVSGVVRSWHDSVNGFVDGVEGVIRYAGPVLFVLLCGVLLWFGGRALWRRAQRHSL